MASSAILDIITVALVFIVALSYAKKGLVYSVVRLAGTVVSWAVSYIYAKPVATEIYFRFFRTKIEKSIAENVTLFAKPGIDSFAKSLEQLTRELPAFISASIHAQSSKYLEKWYQAISSTGSSNNELVNAIAENTIDPVAIALLSVISFLVMFAILSFVVNMVCSLLKGINHIPLLGSLNKILGALFGVVWGLLYVYIIAMVIWLLISLSGDGLKIINSEIIEKSYLFKYFYSTGPWTNSLTVKI